MDTNLPQRDYLSMSMKEVEEAALKDKDFFVKLRYAQNISISPANLAEVKRNCDAFQDEQHAIFENAYKRAFESQRALKAEMDKFKEYAVEPIYAPVQVNSDAMYSFFLEGYLASIQMTVYAFEMNGKLVRALAAAYSSKSDLSEDIRKQMMSDTTQMKALAERLFGNAKVMTGRLDG